MLFPRVRKFSLCLSQLHPSMSYSSGS